MSKKHKLHKFGERGSNPIEGTRGFSARCRDLAHWSNLLTEGHCRACGRAFSLGV